MHHIPCHLRFKDRFHKSQVVRCKVQPLALSGVNRTIMFKRENTMSHHFYLTTWPGHLAISGDLDAFVFCRVKDMFEFFDDDEINPGYWAQKCISQTREDLKSFDSELCRKAVRLDIKEHAESLDLSLSDTKLLVQSAKFDGLFDIDTECERDAQDRLMSWQCPLTERHVFERFYEHNISSYSFSFLWACHAIRWGVKRFFQHQEGRDQESHTTRILEGGI